MQDISRVNRGNSANAKVKFAYVTAWNKNTRNSRQTMVYFLHF